jgi:hypothetical protein
MRSLFSISESENLKISAVDGGGENGEAATLREYWPLNLQTNYKMSKGTPSHKADIPLCRV